ncbi:hypothetical protein ACFYXF_42385 [Streptomyces sp. NPDC002680]|uniref:hypothetical protein n=1 Tax=Streptomyces sp. NPDC002680 TaxID=3364659 RepID=UPI0036CE030E
MGSMRITLCAGAAVAAALTPATLAYAADGGVTVTPASPAPGSDVRLVVRGCTGKTGTAKSEAFVADVLLAGEGQGGALVGGSRIRSSLVPGTYNVTVGCDGQNGKVKGVIAVTEKSSHTAEASPKPSAAASVPVPAPASPVAPVPAGGGGAADELAADARGEGPGTRQAVVGLVLAGVAAVVVAVRGVRRGRGTD